MRKLVFAGLFLLAGTAQARSYHPDFDCSASHTDNPVAVLLCSDSEAAKHELMFDQAYYALRQKVGKSGWKALKRQALADQDFADCLNNPGPVVSGPVHEDAACYIEKTDSLTKRYRARLSGSALEEARRDLDQHIALQQKLADLGYLPSSAVADGVYGEATRTAIVVWQKENGRPRTDGFLSDADAAQLLAQTVRVAPGEGSRPALVTAESSGGWGWLPVLAAILCPVLIVLFLVARHRKAKRDRCLALASGEIWRQKKNLQLQYAQKTIPDRYGTVSYDAWNKEVAFFIRTRILPILVQNELLPVWKDVAGRAIVLINELASQPLPVSAVANVYVSDPTRFDPRMDPFDYEKYCALLLKSHGWDAYATQRSGDQGVDVMAEKSGCRIVIQCKLYSASVGNNAVQQAFTARMHTGSAAAVVVTNSTFSRSAREVAATTGVLLTHHTQLVDVCEKILSRYQQRALGYS